MTPDERRFIDDIIARSAGCPYCRGHGWRRVYSPTYTGEPLEYVDVAFDNGKVLRRPVPAAVNAHCVCPYGRYIRGQTHGDMRLRTPDLADVLGGRSRWLKDDPTSASGEPPARSGRWSVVGGQ